MSGEPCLASKQALHDYPFQRALATLWSNVKGLPGSISPRRDIHQQLCNTAALKGI